MTTKTLFFFAIAAVAVYLLFLRARPGISSSEAHGLVQGGALLLDVRTPGEFASGHIDGALNIPVGELGRRLDELPDKERPVVLYCASGVRSGQATRLLQKAGYANAHNLGGMGRW